MRYRLRWERLGRFVASPSDLMEEVYGLGGPEFDANRLLSNAARLLDELGVAAIPAVLPEPLAEMVDHRAGDGAAWSASTSPAPALLGDVDFDAGLLAIPVRGRAAPVDADGGIGVMPYVGVLADSGPSPTTGLGLPRRGRCGARRRGRLQRPSIGSAGRRGVARQHGAAVSFRMELERATAGDQQAILVLGEPTAPGSRRPGSPRSRGRGRDFYVAAAVRALRLVVDVSDDDLLSQIAAEPIVADAGDVVGGWRRGGASTSSRAPGCACASR